MAIKILLFLSIVASALTLAVTELKVKTKFTEMTESKEKVDKGLDEMTKQKEKFAKEAREKTDELDKANNDLKMAQDAAKTAMDVAVAEQKKAADAQAETKKAQDAIVAAKKMAEEYIAYGKPLALIKEWEQKVPLLEQGRDTAQAEMKVIAIQYQKVKGELDYLKNKDIKVPLPEGLRGKVSVVDPRWDFVVINIGANHGVVKGGEFVVSRGGKLISKLRVDRVEDNQSVANVMQNWKRGDLQEGDEVKAP